MGIRSTQFLKRIIPFRILDCGLPWRDMPGTLYCRCNNSEIEPRVLTNCKPGLGQGSRIDI